MYRYSKNLIPRAKKLRKNMTRQERRLWYEFLRNHECKFNRQKSIGNYIVDFYCHSAKLVIELDGSQHYTDESIGYEDKRSNYLQSLGLKVIRFSNSDIDNDFLSVCASIDLEINLLKG